MKKNKKINPKAKARAQKRALAQQRSGKAVLRTYQSLSNVSVEQVYKAVKTESSANATRKLKKISTANKNRLPVEKRTFNAKNGKTAYTKKFADIIDYAYEAQVSLTKYRDEFGIDDVLRDISNLFSIASSEHLDYDDIQEEGKTTVREALTDIQNAMEQALTNNNTELVKILEEAKTLIENAELLFTIQSNNTL